MENRCFILQKPTATAVRISTHFGGPVFFCGPPNKMRQRLVIGTILLTVGLVLYNVAADNSYAFYTFVSAVAIYLLLFAASGLVRNNS